MNRLLLTLLLALAAVALMAPRPSVNQLNTRVNQLEADQTRQDDEIQYTQDATCAAADVEGGTYRPAFCPARCTVPPGAFDPASDSCESTSTGFRVLRQTLAAGGCLGGVCGYEPVSLGPCQTDADCPGTSQCDPIGFNPGQCILIPSSGCSVDSDCPVFSVGETLYECANVGAPGALPAATCDDGSGSEPVNSGDALACRSDVEAQLGACP